MEVQTKCLAVAQGIQHYKAIVRIHKLAVDAEWTGEAMDRLTHSMVVVDNLHNTKLRGSAKQLNYTAVNL